MGSDCKSDVILKYSLFALFYLDNFLILVEPALRASLMRLFKFMAMRALDERGSRCLEVCISRIRSLLGLFRLGYRHFYTSFLYFREISF